MKMFEETTLLMALFLIVIVLVIWALTRVYGLKTIIDDVKSKIEVMSAPTDTLTQVATAL